MRGPRVMPGVHTPSSVRRLRFHSPARLPWLAAREVDVAGGDGIYASYAPASMTSRMDAVVLHPTFYLLSAAAFGAVLAAVSIALFATRHRAWDWLYAKATRALMRDSLKSGKAAEFRPRRSR